MAPAILAGILPQSMTASAPDYLLDMPPQPALDSKVKAELQAIEQEFSLDKALLDKTMKQMLWEYQTGLAQHADDSNRDTFLPMMYVCRAALRSGSCEQRERPAKVWSWFSNTLHKQSYLHSQRSRWYRDWNFPG